MRMSQTLEIQAPKYSLIHPLKKGKKGFPLRTQSTQQQHDGSSK